MTGYKWREGYSWTTYCIEEAKKLSIKKRQEFMDCMIKDHLSLGDAAKKAELNDDQSNGIMMMQIKSTCYLETTIKK